jgi:16S rRNA processing protein RimM
MDLVVIARIRKAHGVRGEVLAALMTFDPNRFDRLKKVYLRKDRDIQEAEIEKVRNAALGLLIKFKGVDDRDVAAKLGGYEVCVPQEDRLPLPDTEAYFDEIIGMKVVDADSGIELGTVKEVYSYPVGTAYEVRMKDGSLRSIITTGNEIVSLSRSKKEVKVRLLEEM